MRLAAALGAAGLLFACGGSGGITDQTGLHGDPEIQGPNIPNVDEGKQSAAATSLWPLSQGSTWTYRVTDLTKGVFDKHVRVEGSMQVPEMSVSAVRTQSIQPHLEELSWQLESGGLVYRVREEDVKGGNVVRVTTWSPAVVKAVSLAQPQGWENRAVVTERERDGQGTLVKEKAKEFTWQIVETNARVTTPAGTFENAVKIRRLREDKSDWERVYWLVPGVGKVREEGERTEELVQFDIRP